jgi:hypothetical protein
MQDLRDLKGRGLACIHLDLPYFRQRRVSDPVKSNLVDDI